jgi:BNR repeat-like domain
VTLPRRGWGCRVEGVAVSALLLGCLLLFGVGLAGAVGASPVVRVSRCGGQNVEVEQAVDGRFVYEVWMGCGQRIGFARSVNGGRTFGASMLVPGTGTRRSSQDPALAVAPDGTVYVSYMTSSMVAASGGGSVGEAMPAVAVSVDHGRSFARVSKLPVPMPTIPPGNWGDRDFIAVGPDGSVYVTWNYAPRGDQVTAAICAQIGSCNPTTGDFNAVIQRSSDGGLTWSMPATISPGFPLGGALAAPIVAEPNGTLDVLYNQHPTDPTTHALSSGREYFTRSTDGGTTWTTPVAVDPQAGTTSLHAWWIDVSLAVDPEGTLYAAWDTQHDRRDTAWLAWSSNGGQTWSTPLRVDSHRFSKNFANVGLTANLVEVTAAGKRSAYVAWRTSVGRTGYATYLRRFTVGEGWTGTAKRISPAYSNWAFWPGDTFGLSARNGTAIVSWGESGSGSIYATRTTLPAHRP